MKNVDSVARSRFLKIAFWIFPTSGFLAFFVGLNIYGTPIMGLIVGVTIGAIASGIAYFFVEYLGSFGVNLLYGKRKPLYSDSEKFEGEFHQAQHQKSKKEYHKAGDVNSILERILVVLPDKNETYHRWAQTLIDEINSEKASS